MSNNTTTETKVVQMRFDNQKFQKNIDATIKSVNKLDDELEFKKGTKGLNDMSKAMDKTTRSSTRFTIGFRQLLKIKILSGIIDRVSRSVLGFFKNMTGINNVIEGWRQYEEELVTVGGILNQVEKDGYGLTDVANAMETLRDYVDETSFSFTALSNGIRQFTVAGVDLQKATSAAMGITNLAASAKVFDDYKVESAMNAISKAMQQGYLDRMKWNTLSQTSGVVTTEFTKALIAAGEAEGTLIKSENSYYKTRKKGLLVTENNIATTLSSKWINTKVLERALNMYSSASDTVMAFKDALVGGSEESKKSFEEIFSNDKEFTKKFKSVDEVVDVYNATLGEGEEKLSKYNITNYRAMKILEELGYGFNEVSLKAFKSASETTSFSQALKYVKDSSRGMWSQIFKSVFGGLEEATKFFSNISDMLYDIFVAPLAKFYDEVIEPWSKANEGGSADLRQAILNLIEALGKFIDIGKEAFSTVFGGLNGKTLNDFVLKFKDWTESLKTNEKLQETFKSIVTVIASVLKIIFKVVSSIFKIGARLVAAFQPVFDLLLDFITWAADGIVSFIEWIDEIGILESIVKGLTNFINKFANAIKKIVLWLRQKVDLDKVIDSFGQIFDVLGQIFGQIFGWIGGLIEKFADWLKQNEIGTKIAEAFAKAWEKFVYVGQKVINFFKGIVDYFKTGGLSGTLKKSLDWVKGVGQSFADWLVKLWKKIANWLDEKGLLDKFKVMVGYLQNFGKFLKNFFTTLVQPIINAVNNKDAMALIKYVSMILVAFMIIRSIYWYAKVLNSGARVMESVADMFWAMGRKMNARMVQIVATAVMEIAASVYVLILAIEKLANIDPSHAWIAVAIISTLLAEVTAIAIGFFFLTKKISGMEGLGKSASFLSIIAIASAIIILTSQFVNIAEAVSGISDDDVKRVIKIMEGISLVIFIAMFGIRSGGKTPLLINMIKILGTIYLVFWAALKLFDLLKGYSESDIDKGLRVIITIAASLSIMFIAIKVMLLKTQKIDLQGKTISFMVNINGFGIIILAAALLFKMTSSMSIAEIGKGLLAIVAIIAAITIASKILSKGMTTLAATGLSVQVASLFKNLSAIALAVLAVAAVMNIIKSLDWAQMGRGLITAGSFMILLGVFALLYSKLSKVVTTATRIAGIKDIGFSKEKVVGSPVAKALFAIALSMLACVLALKLIADMDSDTFWYAMGKVTAMLSVFFVMAVVLSLINKSSTKVEKDASSLRKVMFTIGITMLAIVGSIVALTLLVDQGYADDMAGAVGVIMIVLASILLFIKVLNKAMSDKSFSTIANAPFKNVRNVLIMVTIMMAVIVGSIIALTYVIRQVGINDVLKASGVAVGILIAIGVLVGILIRQMKKISTNTKDLGTVEGAGKTLVKLLIMITIMIVAISAAIVAISQASSKFGITTVLTSLGIIVTIMYGIVGVIALIRIINSRINEGDGKKFAILAGILGMVLLVVTAFVALTIYISQYVAENKIWKALSIIGIITFGIVGITALLALTTKIVKYNNPATMLALTAFIAAFALSILAIAFAMTMIASIPDEEFNKAAITIGVIAAALLVIILVITIISSKLDPSKFLNFVGISIIIGTIALLILAIAAAMYLISQIQAYRIGQAFRIISVLFIIIGAIAVLLALVATQMKLNIAVNFLAISVLILAISTSMLIIAAALYLLTQIDADRLEQAFRIVTILLIVITGIIAVLALVGVATKGVGAAVILAVGAAILMVAAGVVLLAAAMYLAATSIEKMIQNVQSLKEGDLQKFYELGEAMVALAADSLISGLANFGTALVGVGESVAKLASKVIDFGSSIFEFGSSVLKSFGDTQRAKGIDTLADAMKKLADETTRLNSTEGLETFFTNIDKISEIPGKIKEFIDMKDSLAEALLNFVDAYVAISLISAQTAVELDRIIAVLTLIRDIGSNPNVFLSFISVLNTAFADVVNNSIKPVITPIFDLSQFDAGMDYMRNALASNSVQLSNTQSATGAYEEAGKSKGFWQGFKDFFGIKDKNKEVATQQINITNNFNDSTQYGYDNQRAMANNMANAQASMLKKR